MRTCCLLLMGLLLMGCKPSDTEEKIEKLDHYITVLSDRMTVLEINMQRMVAEKAALEHAALQKAAAEKAAVEKAKKVESSAKQEDKPAPTAAESK